MKNLYTGLISILILIAGLSCADDEIYIPPYDVPYDNTPAVSNLANSFAFSISSNALYFEETYDLSYSSPNVNISVSVAGYGGGQGQFVIKDKEGNTFYSVSLNMNQTKTESKNTGKFPGTVTVSLQNYTGYLAVSMTSSGQ